MLTVHASILHNHSMDSMALSSERMQTSFILFELNNRNLSELLKDLAVENREDFRQQCKNAWSKDYSYITVNIDKRPDERVIDSLFD